ncbi:hypothetical protein H5T87_03620 [bacterium]|nr:hypothetical protein [bacterium]
MINISNYQPGEVVRYPVVLLKGTLSDIDADTIFVINKSSTKRTRVMKGVVHNGRFKVLCELVPGENYLILRAGSIETSFNLRYKPQTNPYYVRIIYFTDKSGDTRYQTPFPDDPQDYRGKLDTLAKLLQTFTAEKFHDLGYPRRTFNLELDENGDVKVHILKGDKSKEEYWKLDGGQLYDEIYDEIARKMPDPYAKNLVIPAFTYYDPEAKKLYAHAALGGGNQALMGGVNLFAWPNSLQDVQRYFMDDTIVNTEKVFSDSVWRDTVWGCASTTIGAALHELGHTFDLPHSTDPYDIMSRGFDYFTRVFTLVEPPHARRPQSYEFKENEEAYWAPINAEAMLANRWLALDRMRFSDENLTDIYIERSDMKLIVQSPNGLGFVGFDYKGESNFYLPLFGKSLKEVSVPLRELGRKIGSEKDVTIRVVDGEGNVFHSGLEELLRGPFIQSWQFSRITVKWQDYNSFPQISLEKLKEIENSARSAPLTRFKTSFIDFTRVFKGENEHIAGYAFRIIKSEGARRIKILTGSDDSLRIWLNGKLVKEVLALRGAHPDEDTTEVELLTGENRLLVEVDNWEGGWGLLLRLEDEDGKRLILTDDGYLKVWDDSQDKRLLAIILGPWVRKWHFSKITTPWENKSVLPHLSDEEMDKIVSSALSQPLTDITEGDAFVDFVKFYKSLGRTTDIVGYVVRKIHCDKPMKARVYIGSDDSFSLRLNGKLCMQVVAMQGAKRDQYSGDIEFQAGDNILLVAVANGGGDWGLFFRLEDEQGNDLYITDDGRLTTTPPM